MGSTILFENRVLLSPGLGGMSDPSMPFFFCFFFFFCLFVIKLWTLYFQWISVSDY